MEIGPAGVLALKELTEPCAVCGEGHKVYLPGGIGWVCSRCLEAEVERVQAIKIYFPEKNRLIVQSESGEIFYDGPKTRVLPI